MPCPAAAYARRLLAALAIAAPWAAATLPVQAAVVSTTLATPLTTGPNFGGGAFDGTGVWFNPLTGYAEERGFFFPNPLFADGQFFLVQDMVSYGAAQAQAQVWVQGFFSRGNGVVYASDSNRNPAQFAAGSVIGSATGYQSPGAGFPDMGPLFGNWSAGDRGFLGLTMRDPSGPTSSDIYYGYADVQVNADYSLTLFGFAYENVRGASIITALAPVPEPGAAALMLLGLAGLAARSRARRGRG